MSGFLAGKMVQDLVSHSSSREQEGIDQQGKQQGKQMGEHIFKEKMQSNVARDWVAVGSGKKVSSSSSDSKIMADTDNKVSSEDDWISVSHKKKSNPISSVKINCEYKDFVISKSSDSHWISDKLPTTTDKAVSTSRVGLISPCINNQNNETGLVWYLHVSTTTIIKCGWPDISMYQQPQ
ncbi:hypothetical protein C5167_029318 [Papaver somniferum]|nr:hypothetical protein C5167_029318 [Papaver somniferum]